MPRIVKKFSDLDLNFTPHPVSGDIIPLTNANAIKRSLRNILFTNTGERPFNPEFGTNLNKFLFEPVSVVTELNIKLLIKETIRIYEPRISIIDISVAASDDENGYNITISFIIDEISELVNYNFYLERLR